MIFYSTEGCPPTLKLPFPKAAEPRPSERRASMWSWIKGPWMPCSVQAMG